MYPSLARGLEHFFFHILRIIIPTDFHIFQRGQCWVDYWWLSPNGIQVGHEPNVPHCNLQRMRWWFQLQPKIRSIFRFWINCVFYPKPESRWKQQLQFASGISFIMFPIKWLWLWVYPILKQTQLWPDGLSVRLLDAEHQILELRFEREQARKGRFHGFHGDGLQLEFAEICYWTWTLSKFLFALYYLRLIRYFTDGILVLIASWLSRRLTRSCTH